MSVTEYVCTRCGNRAGDTNAARALVGLCMSCREDDEHPGRPLCIQCGKRKVTCTEAAFERGVRVCRGCAYDNTVAEAQLDYLPVFEIVEDFHPRCTTYVEQTGGMTMVAYVYLNADDFGVSGCKFCDTALTKVDDVWVDGTDGDCCSGNPYTNENENGVHTPAEDYPRIGFVYDQDVIWSIGWSGHIEDFEGFGIDASDLLAGTDEKGQPTYDGVTCATVEQVAERILLLISNPTLGRTA